MCCRTMRYDEGRYSGKGDHPQKNRERLVLTLVLLPVIGNPSHQSLSASVEEAADQETDTNCCSRYCGRCDNWRGHACGETSDSDVRTNTEKGGAKRDLGLTSAPPCVLGNGRAVKGLKASNAFPSTEDPVGSVPS